MESGQQISPVREKRQYIIPKHFVIIGIGFLSILGLVGGIFVLNGNNKKMLGIRMKVPFRAEPTGVIPTRSPEPTKDPTLNWLTYSNRSYSLKYPSRFKVKEIELPYTVLYPKIFSSTEFSDDISKIRITVARNTANFSADTLIGNGPFLRYAPALISTGTKSLKVSGVDAVLANNIPAGSEGIAVDVLLVAYEKVYQLTLSPLKTDSIAFMALLNTFKVLDQEPDDVTDSWQVYTNNFYGYTLKYPRNFGIDHEKPASTSASSSTLATIFDSSTSQADTAKFKLEVQDIRTIGQSDITSRSFLGLPLDQYVAKKWEYNKASNSAIPEKTVSAIKELTVSGKLAYLFSVTGEYRDDRGSEKLSKEYNYYFTENAGYKYIIWFPKTDTTFSQILKTVIFTK